MKRRAFLKYLNQNNCQLLREGKKHSVFWNTVNRKTTAIPRHTEVSDNLIKKICKDLGIPKI